MNLGDSDLKVTNLGEFSGSWILGTRDHSLVKKEKKIFFVLCLHTSSTRHLTRRYFHVFVVQWTKLCDACAKLLFVHYIYGVTALSWLLEPTNFVRGWWNCRHSLHAAPPSPWKKKNGESSWLSFCLFGCTLGTWGGGTEAGCGYL